MCRNVAAATHGDAGAPRRVQLPQTVKPSHYDVTIVPDFAKFTFDGEVTVNLRTLAEVDAIVLNAFEITIHSATVTARDYTFTCESAVYDSDEQTATLPIGATIGAGLDATLKISYSGIMNDQMAGFYRSQYEVRGATKYMGVTQFEATDARRAVPCWDEPALKATFDVTLVVDSHLTALSNGDVVSDTPRKDGKRVVKFARTPLMATYLLAWVIGELEWIEAWTRPSKHLPNPVRVRVYTTEGLVQQGRFALAVAVKTLEHFSKVFGIPYPLTKYDQVAVPDFAAGAMENWGLVTFRTVALLVDDETGSEATKKWVNTTVTHELAHQWFGNLVTMDQWDALWLNEGFASWVSLVGSDHLFPEHDVWTQFLADDKNTALVVDGLRSSHPIHVEVLDAKEIIQIFDGVSYSKGCSVIHMLTQWLGLDVFFKGIRAYLKKYAYANATTDNLWDALAEASGQDVRSFMSVWTSKTGFPVLRVDESPLPAGEHGLRLHLSQKRYLRTGDLKPEEDTTVWPLPLNVAVAAPTPRIVSHEVMTTKTLDLDLAVDPAVAARLGLTSGHELTYLLNQDAAGLYRVAYSSAALTRIERAIRHGHIGVRDRLAIVDDAFALARAGYAPTAQFLSLLASVIPAETEYVVLSTVAAAVEALDFAFSDAPAEVRAHLDELRRTVFAPHAKRLGFDAQPGESALNKMLRPIMLNVAGRAGDKWVIEEARKRFDRFIYEQDSSAVSSDLYGVVLQLVVAHGGQPEWDAVRTTFKTTQDIDLRYASLRALGAARKPELIQAALDFSMDADHVRPQDLYYVWGPLASSPAARHHVWAFFTSNWDTLFKRYEGNLGMLGTCVDMAVRFSTRDGINKAKAFFEDKDTKACTRNLAQAYDRCESNITWHERDAAEVAKWLDDWALEAKYGY
ncbi:Aminopeptidase 2 mitochondrial [Allomyces arbusculus]|nr:Aminopeptidase 2 mitochondrial [Allomyces arbusculus]